MKKQFSFLSIPSIKSIGHILAQFPFAIDDVKGSFSKVIVIIKSGELKILCGERDIKDFSFVWLNSDWANRDLSHALNLYLNAHKTPHTEVEYCGSKISDIVAFALAALPVADTIYMHRTRAIKEIDTIIETCSFPLIIKDTRGSCGIDSYFVEDKESLMRVISTLSKNKRFIFQSFVPNEYDWGIMVANGEVVSGERSYGADGEFRNNLANGATEKYITPDEIPSEMKELAIKASDILDLSWSRTDIIIDKNTGDPYILEVNRYPAADVGTDDAVGAYTFLSSHMLQHNK